MNFRMISMIWGGGGGGGGVGEAKLDFILTSLLATAVLAH